LCCLAAQAALAIAVDDVLRRPRFNWMSNVWSFAPALLEGILIGILAWWGHFSPWPWLAAAGILGAIVQGCLGWRRLVAGPPVFPAGRFE
jgi:hypothetical protein